MKIRHVQQGIEEGLAGLSAAVLPPGLEGLRQLPVADRNPQVTIRYRDCGRKVREDAAASYFDPDRCEVVIRFVPFENADGDGEMRDSGSADPNERASALDFEEALDQAVSAPRKVEGTRQFVGLKWFRDQVFPRSEHAGLVTRS